MDSCYSRVVDIITADGRASPSEQQQAEAQQSPPLPPPPPSVPAPDIHPHSPLPPFIISSDGTSPAAAGDPADVTLPPVPSFSSSSSSSNILLHPAPLLPPHHLKRLRCSSPQSHHDRRTCSDQGCGIYTDGVQEEEEEGDVGDCVTPTWPGSRIPDATSCPPAPTKKKRRQQPRDRPLSKRQLPHGALESAVSYAFPYSHGPASYLDTPDQITVITPDSYRLTRDSSTATDHDAHHLNLSPHGLNDPSTLIHAAPYHHPRPPRLIPHESVLHSFFHD